MVATMHDKPGAPPGVDNLILVSSDTHIGPKLSQLREYCPKKYLEAFDEFASSKAAEINNTMVQAEIAMKLIEGGTEAEIMEVAGKLDMSADMGMSMAGQGASGRPNREQEIAARMGTAMPTPDMLGAMQMIANRLSAGHYDMHQRLRDMDADGLAVEIIFHGSQNGEPIPFVSPHDLPAGLTTPFTFENIDHELAYAGLHMYNQWLADVCSIEPERHIGLAYIPAWDPQLSLREVEWAREAGLKGINFPAWRPGMPILQDDGWEPIWSASASLNMPLTNHGGAGDDRAWPPAEAVQLRFLESAYHSRRIIWSLLFHGVFDRYPDLKLMISEIPGEWWPYLMKELDSITSMHGGSGDASQVCSEHVFHGATFISREEAQDAYKQNYWENIVWGSDYPHVEGTWQLPMSDKEEPQTHLSLRDSFSGLPEDVVRAMVGLNGIKCYDLDTKELQGVANRICAPSADEVTMPLAPDEVPPAHGLFSFRTVGPWA